MILTSRWPQSKLVLSHHFSNYKHYCCVWLVLHIFIYCIHQGLAGKRNYPRKFKWNNFNGETVVWAELREQMRAPLELKTQGEKVLPKHKGSWKQLRKGFSVGAVVMEETVTWRRAGREQEKNTPTCLPLRLQVPPTGLKQPRSQLAKEPSCTDVSLLGWRTGRERQKTDLGSKQRSGSLGPRKSCLTRQSWFLYSTVIEVTS